MTVNLAGRLRLADLLLAETQVAPLAQNPEEAEMVMGVTARTAESSSITRFTMKSTAPPTRIFSLLLALFVSGTAFAQSSARFIITRSAVAGGGTTFSTSSRFQLGSTIAQPLAAVPSNGRFSIQGGFWIWPSPTIFAPANSGNNFLLSFQSEPGKSYTPQYVDSLSALNWQNLPSVAGDGTVKTVTNSAPSVRQRFYRLIEH